MLQRLLLLLSGVLVVPLGVVVGMAWFSADNGPYMTPLVILTVAVVTAWVLARFAGGLAERGALSRDEELDL